MLLMILLCRVRAAQLRIRSKMGSDSAACYLNETVNREEEPSPQSTAP